MILAHVDQPGVVSQHVLQLSKVCELGASKVKRIEMASRRERCDFSGRMTINRGVGVKGDQNSSR